MKLTILFHVAVASSLLAGTAGQAAAGTESSGIKLEIRLPTSNGYQLPANDEKLIEAYNLAHCQCAETYDGPELPAESEPAFFDLGLELDNISPGTLLGQNAQIWVGDGCDTTDTAERDRLCEQVATIPDLSELPLNVPISFLDFMYPTKDGCGEANETSTVYVLIDTDNNASTFESSLSVQITFDGLSPPVPEASNVSFEPAEQAVLISWTNPTTNNEDIKLYQVLCREQGASDPVFADMAGKAEYESQEMLCPGRVSNPPETDAGVPEIDAGMPDAGMVDAGMAMRGPAGPAHITFDTHDPRFFCGSTSGTESKIRIGGLTNGITYDFILLAVDDSKNFREVTSGEGTPQAAVDFWEDYHNQGGGAEGGICLATSTFGDDSWLSRSMRDFRDNTLAGSAAGRAFIEFYYRHIAPLGVHADRSVLVRAAAAIVLAPAAVLAGFWEYTGAPLKLAAFALLALWWLRRRPLLRARLARLTRGLISGLARLRPIWAGALVTVLALATAGHAWAQIDPYSDEFEPIDGTADFLTTPPEWNAAIRLGPYLPAIDSELELGAGQVGPYEQMFGGSSLMLGFDLDRYFLFPAGQLGVTTSVSWMRQSAQAYQAYNCTEPEAPSPCIPDITVILDAMGNPVRSDGDTTGFRMLPISVGVVYRLTALDEHLRVPLVPYVKAGLSYYLWWITNPSGSMAEVPTDECPDPSDDTMDCDGDRALGASLGYQLSVGLALRAEQLDPRAADSLRNEMGIEHAGFFAELLYAQVDGFGSDTKLHVGDLTWFAGMNFEF